VRFATPILSPLWAACAGGADVGGHNYVLVNARPAPAQILVSGGEPRCEAGCALLHVDGFNNSLDDAEANFTAVETSYHRAEGSCQVFGFAWRSDVGLRHFSAAETVADQVAGPALAAFLRDLRSRCGPQPVHLVGHSLAARVILRALSPSESVQVSSVSLVAPAVFDDALAADGEFAQSVPQAERMFVFFNSQDYMVLGALFPMASRRLRLPLGLSGSRGATLPSVTEVDFGAIWGPLHSLRKSLGPELWAYLLPKIEPRLQPTSSSARAPYLGNAFVCGGIYR